MFVFSAPDCRRPTEPKEYSVRWCSPCDLGRVAGNFTPQDVAGFFDIPYYTHGNHPDANEQSANSKNRRKVPLSERIIRHIAWRVDRSLHFKPEHLGPANNRTFCDIGCGDGLGLQSFRDGGFKVIGVEPDPVALAIAREHGEVFQGTAELMPPEIKGRSFDVVLMMHVLDVCVDIEVAIENVRSILNSKGTLVIETPNGDAKGFQLYGPEWPWTDVPRTQNFFTEKSLRKLLAMNGFAVTQVIYLGYTNSSRDIGNQLKRRCIRS